MFENLHQIIAHAWLRGSPQRFLRRSWAIVLLMICSPGCALLPLWQSPALLRAPESAVAEALGDIDPGDAAAIDPTAIAAPPAPAKLRPCCAFGTALHVTVGGIPVPGLVLDNMRGPENMGPHKYNIGLLAVDSSDERGVIDTENNGQVYTCRGGFIDTAHVRDNADMTVFLNAQVARHLETGGTIELPTQGGRIQLQLKPVGARTIRRARRVPLALAIAQWATFQWSIWHEIASWYGCNSVAGFPEKISTFSPEDLYSNLLGIKLAGGMIAHGDTTGEREYNRAMDAWLAQAFHRLHAVPKAQAEAAMLALDGRWWDSSKALPDWQVVTRRNMHVATTIHPWLLPLAFAPGTAPDVGCSGAGAELALHRPLGFEGIRFADVATLDIEVADALVAEGFPLRAAGERGVTQKDFPRIIKQIRREITAVLGSNADQPGPPPPPGR